MSTHTSREDRSPTVALAAAPTIAEFGEALYGAQWQTPMALALGVHLRTVQHWATGRYRPSSATMGRLVVLLTDRQARNAEVWERGRAMVDYFKRIRGKK